MSFVGFQRGVELRIGWNHLGASYLLANVALRGGGWRSPVVPEQVLMFLIWGPHEDHTCSTTTCGLSCSEKPHVLSFVLDLGLTNCSEDH